MEKRFIPSHSLPKKVLESGEASKYFYSRVKHVASKKSLCLNGENLKVGHEVFFGVKDENDKPFVVAALCKGYQLETDFQEYDDENGMVDCHCNPIYLGEDGNTYKWTEDIITSVFDNRQDAIEELEAMIEDDMV